MSQDSTLNFIELAAWLVSGTNDLAVTLRADRRGLAGAVLESFSFTGQLAPSSQTPSSATILTGTSLLNSLLTAGKLFWSLSSSVPLGALRVDATPVPLTAVPEPTTLSLLGAALFGFRLIRRQNRRT